MALGEASVTGRTVERAPSTDADPPRSGLEPSAGEVEPQSTRDRILGAALAGFAERGVEATSLDAVAGAAGVRKQTLLYWFPSKEQLLFGVVDHTVADIGDRLGNAARAATPARPKTRNGVTQVDPPELGDARTVGGGRLGRQLVAVVDAIFRLGTTHPALLAVVREVARLGPPASTHLAAAVAPLVEVGASALGAPGDERVRKVLLAAGARVVGIVTEAEVRSDLGLPADLAWLRAQRRALLASLLDSFG
jgi:AcrR family transcriptional regulator